MTGRQPLKSGDRLRFDVEEFEVSVMRPGAWPTRMADVAATQVAGPEAIAEIIRALDEQVPGGAVGASVPTPRSVPVTPPEPPPGPVIQLPRTGSRSMPVLVPPPPLTGPHPVIPPREAAPSPPPPVAAPSAPPAPPEPPPAAPPPRAAPLPPTAPLPAVAAFPPVPSPPPPPARVSDSESQKRPGAWADTLALQAKGNKRTHYIPPADIKQMIDKLVAPTAADPAMDDPYLEVVSGGRVGAKMAMPTSRSRAREWAVGSDRERDIVFFDDGVSGLHARIVNDGRRWKVIDQMSANGTFVNGKRSSLSYLAPGDRIVFGRTECIFHLPGSFARASGPNTLRRIGWAVAAISALALVFIAYRLLS